MSKETIAIDIGGTSIKGALVNEAAEISETMFADTPVELPAILHVLTQMIDALQVKANNASGVGICVPGIGRNGNLLTGGVLHALAGVNLRQQLKGKCSLPVGIDNDANAATLAEQKFGMGQGVKTFGCVTVGTGIGSGLVINNELLRGNHGMAGEIGQTVIFSSADFHSGSASQNGATVDGLLRVYNSRSNQKTDSAQMVIKAAQKGDLIAQHAVKWTLAALARTLTNLSLTIDPDLLIIGGGISNNAWFIEQLKQQIKDDVYLNPDYQNLIFPEIVPAKFHNQAGMIGAMILGQAASAEAIIKH